MFNNVMFNEDEKNYLRWLTSKVVSNFDEETFNYCDLFTHLFVKTFTVINPLDLNRYNDGIELRYRYAQETGQSYAYIAAVIDIKDCSILEMMAALALRCEEDIMTSTEYGDRTSVWFSQMLNSLGLYPYNDVMYDAYEVDTILIRFLNKEYSSDGKGGLFRIDNCQYDLRTMEIWYQCQLYLNTIDDYNKEI